MLNEIILKLLVNIVVTDLRVHGEEIMKIYMHLMVNLRQTCLLTWFLWQSSIFMLCMITQACITFHIPSWDQLRAGYWSITIELEAHQMHVRHSSCKPPISKESDNSTDLVEPKLFWQKWVNLDIYHHLDSSLWYIRGHWSHSCMVEHELSIVCWTSEIAATRWCHCVIPPCQRKKMPNPQVIICHSFKNHTAICMTPFVYTLPCKRAVLP